MIDFKLVKPSRFPVSRAVLPACDTVTATSLSFQANFVLKVQTNDDFEKTDSSIRFCTKNHVKWQSSIHIFLLIADLQGVFSHGTGRISQLFADIFLYKGIQKFSDFEPS